MSHPPVTPDYVQTLTQPTPDFLCSLDANHYGIEFTAFKIRSIIDHSTAGNNNMDINNNNNNLNTANTATGETPSMSSTSSNNHRNTSTITHFEVKTDDGSDDPMLEYNFSELTDEARRIRYNFGPMFLDLKTVGTELEFVVKSDKEVRDLRMIERHYFRDKIIKSFDFSMPYCIPRTKNTWEIIYCMPQNPEDDNMSNNFLTPELKAEIIANPWETKSDSFYFVDGELIMHNKAEYNYSDGFETRN